MVFWRGQSIDCGAIDAFDNTRVGASVTIDAAFLYMTIIDNAVGERGCRFICGSQGYEDAGKIHGRPLTVSTIASAPALRSTEIS